MTQKGHEDHFPRPSLSVRRWFVEATFAETHGNGLDAPIAAVRPRKIALVKPALSSPPGTIMSRQFDGLADGRPPVWQRTEAVAVEFRCSGASKERTIRPSGRESGEC